MTPLRKFGLVIKTDSTIHTPTEYEPFISHIMRHFKERSEKVPSRPKKSLERERKKPGQGFLRWLEGQHMMVFLSGMNFLLVLNESTETFVSACPDVGCTREGEWG